MCMCVALVTHSNNRYFLVSRDVYCNNKLESVLSVSGQFPPIN